MDLVKYENAKAALAELLAVDDVKEFRNKAIAVEAYARQANDYQLERDAATARVTAERKCGELLRDMPKAVGGVSPTDVVVVDFQSNKPKSLKEMGISRVQSSKWQQLAAVPDQVFDNVINDLSIKVSTARVLKAAKPTAVATEVVDPNVLWFFSRLINMERRNIFKKPVHEYIAEIGPDVRPDADRIIGKLKKWLDDPEGDE